MKKIIFLLLLVTIAFGSVSSQQISISAISPAGDQDKSGSLTLDWILGDIAIETALDQGRIFTEGFLQPHLSIQEIVSPLRKKQSIGERTLTVGGNIKIYPNPVHLVLIIDMPSIEMTMEMRLINAQGSIVFAGNLAVGSDQAEVQMEDYPNGIYLLQVFNEKSQFFKSYKVVKH